MNRGKQICELLNGIRKDIAETYGLDYKPTDCDFEGECAGFCRKCDAEIRDLEHQLNNKDAVLAAPIYKDFKQYVSERCLNLIDTISNFDNTRQLQGIVAPLISDQEEPKIRLITADKKKGDTRKTNKNDETEDVLSLLKKKLGRNNLELCTSENDFVKAFEDIADIFLNKVAIRKGDKIYYIKDVEFYLYNDRHRDIITYPRVCEAGQWFFHSSGVDISFESYVKTIDDENGLFRPVLDREAFFGGVLIRQIYPAGKSPADAKKCHLDGPHKAEWELFDRFDAFNDIKNFPHLVAREDGKKKLITSKRLNILPKKKKAEWKVGDILKYNYAESEIPEAELVTAFNDFIEAKYRFTV